MSNIRFSPDLFIGKQELDRFQTFMQEKLSLMIKTSANSWGILKNGSNVVGNNFLVQAGASSGTIKIAYESLAIDSNVNLIKKRIEDNIAITNDSNWYWLMISYNTTNIEDGIVAIDVNGNLTGVGTKFTETLRGIPDFPSKIKFSGSSSNISEYEVVNVIDDTNAIIAGIFTAETGLNYKIVGTFTPGIVVDENKKYPFNYDSCQLNAVAEDAVDTPPSKISGLQFYIARVRNVSGTVTIQDKRVELYTTNLG